MPGCPFRHTAMSHVTSYRPRSSPLPWLLKPATAFGAVLLAAVLLALPASAHTYASPHPPLQPNTTTNAASRLAATVAKVATHAVARCADSHRASAARVTSTMHVFNACHQGCGGCDGCSHCCKSCASSPCNGGHSHALISVPAPGLLAAMWRSAAPPLDEGADGLAPLRQFKPPRV